MANTKKKKTSKRRPRSSKKTPRPPAHSKGRSTVAVPDVEHGRIIAKCSRCKTPVLPSVQPGRARTTFRSMQELMARCFQLSWVIVDSKPVCSSCYMPSKPPKISAKAMKQAITKHRKDVDRAPTTR